MSGAGGSSWVVLSDADCGFCKRALALLLRWDRSAARLRPLALQRFEAAALLAELTPSWTATEMVPSTPARPPRWPYKAWSGVLRNTR